MDKRVSNDGSTATLLSEHSELGPGGIVSVVSSRKHGPDLLMKMCCALFPKCFIMEILEELYMGTHIPTT